MECFLFWSILYLSLLSVVSCLKIVVNPNVTVNNTTTIFWAQEVGDPPDFDFRFVINDEDVGLARANIVVNDANGAFGRESITFPRPGRYVIKAVSGSPQFTVIGTSNPVVVNAAPTVTLALPSTTVTTTPSVTSSTSTVLPSAAGTNRAAIIVGVLLGTLVLVGFVATLIVYLVRRRRANSKPERLSFHPDQMIQRRSRFLSSLPKPVLTIIGRRPDDVEQGISNSDPVPPTTTTTSNPNPFLTFAENHSPTLTVPPPAIIRPLPSVPAPRNQSESPPLSAHREHRQLPQVPRTRRQREIEYRIQQLKEQISELQQDRASLDRVLRDLEKEMKWLKDHVNSEWALGLTDTPPPGFSRYMTP